MNSFTRRDFLKIGGSAAAGTLTGLSATGQGMSGEKKPNILFLMMDQYRGDCLGCDGNSVIKTPNLDRIAREGFRFSNAYTSTPSCTPARSALLTGMSPWNHGMLGYSRVPFRFPFELPRAIREAGYHTLGIGKMHWHPQRNRHGFHKTILDESSRVETPDFESDYRAWFRKHAPKGMDYDVTGIGWNDYRSRVYIPPEELHPTRWTAEVAIDYIESYNKEEPFFLKVSFARPHSPYDPPQRFWDAYREDEMPVPDVGKWAENFAPCDPSNYTLWHGDLGIEQARKSRRGYYGSISFIDEEIGRILSILERRGLLENTLILVTADHGDMMGDHHHWRKSYAYEGSARIPFLVRPPAGITERRGEVFEQVVELRDVFPTFLDAAGRSVPDNLDGISVLDLIRGKTEGWRDVLDLEHDRCYNISNQWNAVTDGKYKYIYHAYQGEEQLFNLVDDPGELHDLARDSHKRSLVREWRGRMIEQLSERGEPFVVNGDLAPRPDRMLHSPNFPKS